MQRNNFPTQKIETKKRRLFMTSYYVLDCTLYVCIGVSDNSGATWAKTRVSTQTIYIRVEFLALETQSTLI